MDAISSLIASAVLPLMFQGMSAPEAIWPITVAGWVTLVASIGTLILIPFSYGKWIQKMNGMGARVGAVEVATSLQGAFQQEDSKRRLVAEAEARHMGERVKALEVTIEAMEKTAHEHHAEQRALILEMAGKQTDALHNLGLKVERLAAQSDMGAHMVRIAETVERGLNVLKKERSE